MTRFRIMYAIVFASHRDYEAPDADAAYELWLKDDTRADHEGHEPNIEDDVEITELDDDGEELLLDPDQV